MHVSFRPIKESDDAPLAAIIRAALEACGLDIPGTAYFDPELDRLSAHFLAAPGVRAYFTALDGDGRVVGGVGFDRYADIDGCAEVQKLYLDPSVRGHGFGREMIALIEREARALGYDSLYLETHSALKAASRLYENCGFVEVRRPASAIHATMDRFYFKKI